MKSLLIVLALFCNNILAFGQFSETVVVQKHFNGIKATVQPQFIQLPDSQITFPITGLTFIRLLPPTQVTGVTFIEIEFWIVDAKDKVIYNNIILSAKPEMLDQEYSRYMKLQSNFLKLHRQNGPTLSLH